MAKHEMAKNIHSKIFVFFQFDRIFFLPFGYSPALFKKLPEGFQLFPYQMTKIFYICKRIFFAISNFAIIEEVISYLKDGWLYVLLLFFTWKYQEVIYNPFEFKSYSRYKIVFDQEIVQ